MNAYPGFPPCLDSTDAAASRGDWGTHSKTSHAQTYTGQTPFLQQCRKRVLQTHSSVFIESALSPAKYALFQLFGSAFLHLCPCPRSPGSYTSSAKIGAFGGTIVTIFYLILVLTRTTPSKPDVDGNGDPGDVRQSAMVLLHEMLYSAVASAMGCMAYSKTGHHVDLAMQTLVGWVGPVIFLLVLSSCVGVAWCLTRAYKKSVDWYAGY